MFDGEFKVLLEKEAQRRQKVGDHATHITYHIVIHTCIDNDAAMCNNSSA